MLRATHASGPATVGRVRGIAVCRERDRVGRVLFVGQTVSPRAIQASTRRIILRNPLTLADPRDDEPIDLRRCEGFACPGAERLRQSAAGQTSGNHSGGFDDEAAQPIDRGCIPALHVEPHREMADPTAGRKEREAR